VTQGVTDSRAAGSRSGEAGSRTSLTNSSDASTPQRRAQIRLGLLLCRPLSLPVRLPCGASRRRRVATTAR